ncbi:MULTISPECIES: response regulator transcription factor [Bacillaceae]|uniref:Response regulator transcription factor n=1 Tax=Evansella alkalicola TaxID=745819 RepID=A0ABS6JPL0_9BACI|nr:MULTISPECIES: response regulator transcription factor [Bacillaceae]MBU9720370.1 response regulator transcription factor [Bacillus alkalicola]
MKVLIGINHELVRYGLIQLLKDIQPIESMVMVATTEEFIEALREYEFDLTIVDVGLRGAGGTKSILLALNELPNSTKTVFMYNDHDVVEDIFHMENRNLFGVFHEKSTLEDLMDTFQKIMAGEKVILNKDKKSEDELFLNVNSSLSNREKEVFHLKVRGYTVKDTAKLLNISPKTVENHRRNIKNKLLIVKSSEWYEWAQKLNMM